MSKLIKMLKAIEGCEMDFVSELQTREEGGRPCGALNGIPFFITFAKQKYLLLSVYRDGDWESALGTLADSCMEFTGVEPICRYDRNDDYAAVTFEWDCVDPEARLRTIVNGGEEFANDKIDNLVLLGDRKLADYENEETRQAFAEAEVERVENARIYGIDPGGCDVERIKKATEWELFLDYFSLTKVAWQMNHNGARDHSRGHISDKEWAGMQASIAEMQYGIEYLLYVISKKIGVDVPEPEVDKHISPDREMFMRWYRFYDNHFSHTLSDEQWQAFEEKRKAGEDVSEYLPAGNWREAA